MDGKDLTQKQRAILDYIVETVARRRFPPTVREIGESVGLSSPSTVHAHLRTLEERGYLRRDRTKPRAIEVRWERDASKERGVRRLPIYGSIAAGPTTFAEQNLEESLPFPKDFISDAEHFILRVKGDSMIDEGILDGDLIVVRAQPDAANGDIVAAQIKGETGESEATVKRFRRQDGRIMLVPANPNMQPIQASPDTQILGKVVALLRRL